MHLKQKLLHLWFILALSCGCSFKLWHHNFSRWVKAVCPNVTNKKSNELELNDFHLVILQVRDFHVAKSEADIGFYAGILGKTKR